jgi:membrane-associated phospholipid phosphatase
MAAEEAQRPTRPPPGERLAGRLAAEEPRRRRIPRAKAITAPTELALAVDSAAVTVGCKLAARRRRPDRVSARVPALRQVPMPYSASFPSGHAASGFAFASAVGQTLPTVAAPLRLLASVVGYSRVHTGVHHAGDVVMGATIGASIGDLVGWGLSRRGRPGASAR